MSVQRVHVVDSHTAGEPTRVVIAGAPDLGDGNVAERLRVFRAEHDRFRSAMVNEPRGSDVLVGALLVEPSDPSCIAGVIFFNNVGTLGMCGHGTIGLMVTLAHLGRIGPGTHRIETPVGVVTAQLYADGNVSVQNVPSYRYATGVRVSVPGHREVTGDVAWGGNWFFLCEDHGQELSYGNVEALTEFTWRIRESLKHHGITGRDDQEIDHIEMFSSSPTAGVHSRNFVLCPGKAYDRSPCGTGTSAKLACLYAAGKLRAGEIWRQESIIGSLFEGSVETDGDLLLPTIRGSAYVNAEATLILDPADPFCHGIRS
jgi:4-hydroxyproline epimerase